MKKEVFILFAFLFLTISLASAQEISLDINIGKQIYAANENATYQVLLLKDSSPLSDTVQVSISDIAKNKVYNYEVTSNREQYFFIEKDLSSGYWQIEASYQGKSVKRFFTIGEREEVEFRIEGDKLIIKNTGNAPYTKTIQILIGEKVITQKQDIEVGQFKEIRLVAPDGRYNIQVTDGTNSISKQDVILTGTGAVVGALDEQLLDNQPLLGTARDVKGESFFTSKNFSVAFIFIGAVFGLFVLLLIEKVMRRKRASAAQDLISLH